MGAYKFYNPTTQQWEIIKSKSVIKDDGSLEYTPDDIKDIDDKVDALTLNKVDKVSGKGLSTNDYTTTEKNKLAGIATGAQKNAVTSVAGKTGAVTVSKSDVGLGNVDNLSAASIRGGTTKANVGLGSVDNIKQMPIAGGTFTGVAMAQANTSYTTRQLRNTILSTGNPSGGSNGDIWIKYV